MQSVPAQGQTPQTFETSADILAKADWNALPVQTGVPWLAPGTNEALSQRNDNATAIRATRCSFSEPIERTGTRAVLRRASSGMWWSSTMWRWTRLDNLTLRVVGRALFSRFGKRHWEIPPPGQLRRSSPFVRSWGCSGTMRRARISSSMLDIKTQTSLPALIDASAAVWQWKWNNFAIPNSDHIYLERADPKVVVGSWFALTQTATRLSYTSKVSKGGFPRPHLLQYQRAQLYKVKQATSVSLAEYALSMKVTELAADYEDTNIQDFPLPATEVWAQSESSPCPNNLSIILFMEQARSRRASSRPCRYSSDRCHGQEPEAQRQHRSFPVTCVHA